MATPEQAQVNPMQEYLTHVDQFKTAAHNVTELVEQMKDHFTKALDASMLLRKMLDETDVGLRTAFDSVGASAKAALEKKFP